jgi:hypothetical protein
VTTTAAEPAVGVELRPLEVTFLAETEAWSSDRWSMDQVFDELRKRGIDTGRPMWLHVDTVARQVTARQEPWRAE